MTRCRDGVVYLTLSCPRCRDVQLELEDDPVSGTGGADTTSAAGGLCDGRPAPVPHWEPPSAVISEPQLHVLLMESPTRCPSCLQPVPPNINRISLSYSVTWVSERHRAGREAAGIFPDRRNASRHPNRRATLLTLPSKVKTHCALSGQADIMGFVWTAVPHVRFHSRKITMPKKSYLGSIHC